MKINGICPYYPGKGRVQSILNLEVDKVSEGHLKLTTAKYFTPSGVCIDGKGISPDHLVPFSTEQLREMLLARRSRHWERNDPRGNGRQPPLPEMQPVPLPAAPSGPQSPPTGDTSGAKDGTQPPKSKAPFHDLQLEKAVEVLTRQLQAAKPLPGIAP